MNTRTLQMTALAASIAAAACGEDEVQPVLEQLVRTSASGECTQIQTGLDRNRDGELSADEVETTETICPGDPGDPGDPGLRSLIRTSEEPAGANCPNGGQKVEAGVDDDRDDELDAEEVDVTTYVCVGETGDDAPALLTRSSTIAEGDECDFGGVRIDTGYDLDASGELEEGEIEGTRFVCNGEDGQPVLVVIDELPPGGECSAGGRLTRSGIDENGDGQLSIEETLDEELLCNPVSTLVEVTEIVVGTSTICTNGGQRVDVGLDVNADGTLEASEIDATTFVCNGADGLPLLARRRSEPAGDNCEFGGVRIAYGVDQNGNRILEADEEETVTYACDGEDGLDSGEGGAARVANEPPGENCVRGGTRIETGPDQNGNGQLDDGEVTNTTYACNGQSAVGLVSVFPEPAGSNCADGGQRIESGPDSNANGELDPAEVQSTIFVCSTVAQVPIRIDTDGTLTDAIRNNAYSATIEAIGGVGGGYQWSFVNPAAVPAGLTIEPSGTPSTVISGTPSALGTFTFEVEVTDFFGNSATKSFTLTVEGQPLSITSFTLPRLENGVAYSAQLTAAGGNTQTTPATWTLVGGTLPAGLSLGSGGQISGTPTTERGSFFIVEADDGTETMRAGLRIKGEQKFGAYCGDHVVDLREDISVFEFGAGPTVTSTGTIVDNAAIEADCFEEVQISGQRDVIVFMGNETSGIDELYAVDLSTFPNLGSPVKLNPTLATTDNDVFEFKISPTGDWVAFRADDRANLNDELFVYDLTNLGTASPVRVNTAQVDIFPDEDYAWVPGSNKLVYISDELVSFEDNIFLYDADAGGTPTQLNGTLVSGGDVSTYAVSPDGNWVAYVADQDVDNDVRLYVVDISGATPGTPQEVTGSIDPDGDVGTSDGDIGFSPNGKWLYFIGDYNNGGDELLVVDMQNLQAEPLLLSQNLATGGTLLDVVEAVWSPDGRRIAYRGDAVTSAVDELFVADTLVPGSPVQVSPTLPSGADVNSITGVSGDEFAWAPDGSYLIYDVDPNVSGQDEPYLTFIDDPTNPVRVFPNGLSDDVLRVKIADDGEAAFMVADLNGTTIQELFLVEIGASTVQTPVAINDPTPLGASQDVDDEFSLVDGGNGVLYWSDEVTTDDDEAFFRTITGGTIGSRTRVNPTLPTGGDVDLVTVQEE